MHLSSQECSHRSGQLYATGWEHFSTGRARVAPGRVVSIKWQDSPRQQQLTPPAAPDDRVRFWNIIEGIALVPWLPLPSLGLCATEGDERGTGKAAPLGSAPDAPSRKGPQQLQEGHLCPPCVDMESDGS